MNQQEFAKINIAVNIILEKFYSLKSENCPVCYGEQPETEIHTCTDDTFDHQFLLNAAHELYDEGTINQEFHDRFIAAFSHHPDPEPAAPTADFRPYTIRYCSGDSPNQQTSTDDDDDDDDDPIQIYLVTDDGPSHA